MGTECLFISAFITVFFPVGSSASEKNKGVYSFLSIHYAIKVNMYQFCCHFFVPNLSTIHHYILVLSDCFEMYIN